jgi:predicted glycogen debranching enzyme
MRFPMDAEWLETDGCGGFASGTVSGIRTRRYHALLLVATTPPTGRMVLVNGFEAWVSTAADTVALTSQRYVHDVTHPDGRQRIASFEPDPWPRWTYQLEDGTVVEQEIFVPQAAGAVVITWRLVEPTEGVTLAVRPLISGRAYHALHHENVSCRFEAATVGERVTWRPYSGVPAIVAMSNASYAHQPEWYRSFQYEEERERGLDFIEDLAAPGILTWDLSRGEGVLILSTEASAATTGERESALACVKRWRGMERRRRRAVSRLERSASEYVVERGEGKTIIAGYPWFTDWGRDTFIAMRGLCLATGRLDVSRDILVQWAGTLSDGMLPNRFPDAGEQPEFNAVDASLWFMIAVHEFLEASRTRGRMVADTDHHVLRAAVDAILDGYLCGTRYRIRCDDDGLLAAGEPGVQVTWMDAKVGDRVVTPRAGKAVEVQALWLNTLRIASAWSPRCLEPYHAGSRAFESRFWNQNGGYLNDVVDVDHHAGAVDATFRPNQILAVGGLPYALLDGDRARQVVDAVEARLLTPMGLRSLAPDDPAYIPRHRGSASERDAAYHQGTVWPWLIGPFVEAWVRVRGGTSAAKREAHTRFLVPLLHHLDEAGIGHISEIADGDPPHTPRGCPFQAWSLGEALRLEQTVLAEQFEESHGRAL